MALRLWLPVLCDYQYSGFVMKNWHPDRFQRPQMLLQRPIFVDRAPAKFINLPSTWFALNRMVKYTSASWKNRPDAAIRLGEDNSYLYLLTFRPALIWCPSWSWNEAILSFRLNTTHQTELSSSICFTRQQIDAKPGTTSSCLLSKIFLHEMKKYRVESRKSTIAAYSYTYQQ